MKKKWQLIKKIFFVLFIAHFSWFLFFIFQKFSVAGFSTDNFQSKLLIICVILLILGLVYYFLLRKIKIINRIAVVLKELFFVFYVFFIVYLIWGLLFNPPVTFTQLGSLAQGYGMQRDYVSYNNMGRNIKLAVIASEDQQFPDHDGFDLKAIKVAMKYNQRNPKKIRGASTISQQVAKNVFLFQGGGFFRKGIEVFVTFSIEQFWTKRTILERYLNVAEMGPGIFGVQAAAKAYFKKDAAALTATEAAQIAACLPSPKRYTVKPLSKYVSGRASTIVRQMNNLAGDPDVQAIVK